MEEKKICVQCKRELPLEEFNKWAPNCCNECWKEVTGNGYERAKKMTYGDISFSGLARAERLDLSPVKAESERILQEAREEAERIICEAKLEADRIIRERTSV